jgi:2-polyprenyl-3-methyl-5-hydroxy-6-metoxy-1,4-benzoquinol methylase
MDLSRLYAEHHTAHGRLGFSIAEAERASWFSARITALKRKGLRLLDVGCRDATLTRHFVDVVEHVTGIDVDPNALEVARNRIPTGRFIHMDILSDWSALSGESFDVILCSEVLEHVYYPERVCEKIGHLLASGGIFIGSVPNAFFLKHRLRYLMGARTHTPLEDPTHITQFHEPLLRQTLGKAGSNITIAGWTRPPFSGLANRLPGMFAFDFLFEVRR